MLVDHVEFECRAGQGGDGLVAWRREKFVPKGGPDGGDGGCGGSIFLRATTNLENLSGLRYSKIYKAEDGQRGGNRQKTGADGQDLEILVPIGTVVTDLNTDQQIADLSQDNQRLCLAKGGRGGLGNVHFARSNYQRPQKATAGETGQVRRVRLELRLIADLALIGPPNAGKSSLLEILTGAHARIGPFAFSTTEPILGVAKINRQKITLVDLPGLIEGAHQGRGLGDQFLKHARRVKGLIYVLDINDEPLDQYRKVKEELKLYRSKLSQLPALIVLNKTDLADPTEIKTVKSQFKPESTVAVSASAKTGLEVLKTALVRLNTWQAARIAIKLSQYKD